MFRLNGYYIRNQQKQSILFEGVWFSNYPSSLPLCVRSRWLLLRFCSRGCTGFTSLKRFVFRGLMRVPAAGSHLKRFWLRIVLSFGFGAQVFSRPRFLSSGLGLARLVFKSLRFCNVFCVDFSKTTVNVDSKSKLCAPNVTFELLAAVLWCFQNALQNPTKSQKSAQKTRQFAHVFEREAFF